MESRQLQFFVEMTKEPLGPSHYILTDSVGVAAGLVRDLKRDGTVMYGQVDELKYSLDYPDIQDRFVNWENFVDWLTQHHQQGDVTFVLLIGKDGDIS